MWPRPKVTCVCAPAGITTLMPAAPGIVTVTLAAEALVLSRWMLSFTMPGEARSNQWKYEVSPVNVNWSRGDAAVVPLAVVTVMSVVLTVCAGLMAVTVVSFTTLKLAAAVAPKATAVRPLLKPFPVSVTEVPPVEGPELGETLTTACELAGVSAEPTVNDHVYGTRLTVSVTT